MKIRTTFILALSFFSLSSIIAYSVFSSINMNGSAERQYERLYSDIATSEGKNVTEYVKSVAGTSSVLASDTALTGFNMSDSGEMSTALETAETYINSATGIKRIVFLDSSDSLVGSTESGYELSYTDEQMDTVTSGGAYISPIYSDEGDGRKATGEYEIAVFNKLSDRTIGVYFSSDTFNTIVKSGNFPTNGRVIFVDGLGNIIDDTTYAGLLSDTGGRGEYATIYNAVYNDNSLLSTPQNFEIGRNPRISYTVKASGSDWYAASMAEVDKAYAYSSGAVGSLVGVVVAVSVIFIVFNVIAIILITKPLAVIEETLVKIHRGDHDSRIDINSNNEYGEISTAFNNLIDNVVVSERRYRTIVEMADDIVFEWNLKTNNVIFSNNFNKKFSYRATSDHFSDSFFLKGKVHPEDNDRYRSDLAKLEQGVDFKDNQYRWKNIYGDYIWVSVKTSTIRDSDNNPVKVIGVLSDVDRAKKGEMKLIQQARFDALTGVYNRETIENVIDNEIHKVADGNDGFAILFVDIDDFKIYNDLYSHATGDQVLKFVTDSISEIIEDYGFIGRYGGDEFIVCIRNTSTNVPQRVAQDILTKLKAGFVCDSDARLSVSVSIGIYMVNSADKSVDEIISIADDAMYNIKKNGKSSFGVVIDESSNNS